MKTYRAFRPHNTTERPNSMMVGYKYTPDTNWRPPKEGVECPLCGKIFRTLLGTHCQRFHKMKPEEFLEKTGLFQYQCSTDQFKDKMRKQAKELIKEGKIDPNKLGEMGKKVISKWQSQRRKNNDWGKFNQAGRVRSAEIANLKRETIVCDNCGKSFFRKGHGYRKSLRYCSLNCYLSDRKEVKCTECGKLYLCIPRNGVKDTGVCRKCYHRLWKRKWFDSLSPEGRENLRERKRLSYKLKDL